ncbi:hypothetical protein TWF694_000009 [Orbilia ellipsospora]|uniref:CHCH domain-containing protein n=1 Tax=Orbilia ellipsospora TaxID=2528407 RepID=A0AAV9XMB5_9PEZI
MLPYVDTEDDSNEWEMRIDKTGCSKEHEKLQSCFDNTRDWRVCQKELRDFKDCWSKRNTGGGSQTRKKIDQKGS